MPNETDGRARQGLSIPDKQRLMDAVNDHPLLHDPRQRQAVLNELRDELGNQFDPHRYDGSNADLWAIVSTCIRLGAVPTFVSVLKIVGGPVNEWYQLNDVVTETSGRGVGMDAIRTAAEELGGRLWSAAMVHERT